MPKVEPLVVVVRVKPVISLWRIAPMVIWGVICAAVGWWLFAAMMLVMACIYLGVYLRVMLALKHRG